MEYPLKPLTFRLLVKPVKVATMSAGGIILGTEAEIQREQDAATQGQVLAKGPAVGTFFEKEYGGEQGTVWGPIEVRDYILYKSHHGLKWKSKEGDKYLILNDEDVIAWIHPDQIEREVI